MIGWLLPEERRGWRIRLEEDRTEGIRLLRASIPLRPGGDKAIQARQIARAALRLRARGCRRAVAPPGFGQWDAVQAGGLAQVDLGPMCQSLAAPLALRCLALWGIPADRAVVALRGRRVNRWLFETAGALCPLVRNLVLAADDGGEDLTRWLEGEYGLPGLRDPAQAHLCLHFSVPVQPPGEEDLVLCGPAPVLGPVALRCRRVEHPGIDPLALLGLLWEEGKVKGEEIEIISSSSRESLDRKGQTTYNREL